MGRKEQVENWKLFVEWSNEGLNKAVKDKNWKDYRYYYKQRRWFQHLVDVYG